MKLIKFRSALETFKKELPDIFVKIENEVETKNDIYNEYAFFSHLLRYFIYQYNEGNNGEVEKIASFIERFLTYGDEEVKNLAATGFLETLYVAGNNYNEIKKKLGKLSLKFLNQID